jgi:RNA polymerase sigma-70 factor (ECF subfamily)
MWLRFCAQLRLKEIAATLDLPVGTVKSRLHKALKVLRANKELAP